MFLKRLVRCLTPTRLLFGLIILGLVIIFNSDLSPDLYFIKWGPSESISCYFDNADDILPSAEDKSFSPAPESIFFLETSCRGGINSRDACSVEAAARAHPDKKVYLLFTGPVRTLNRSLKRLQALKNVRFARIHILEYAKGTPAESLVASGALFKTRWRISHTSDVLRFLTLYKWSGVYLDIDALVVKSFKSLKKNWVTRETDNDLSSGALSFSADRHGRLVARMALMDIVNNFRGDSWGHNGPKLVTRVMKRFCDTSYVTVMTADTCKGFEVYSNALFLPISWKQPELYLKEGVLDWPWVYVYHVWNANEIEVPENSRYDNLAKKYCPSLYKSTHFGRQPKLEQN